MTAQGCMKSRDVLWYLIFCGCVVNFMVTTNINIAIVAMVIANTTDSNVTSSSECLVAELSSNSSYTSPDDGLTNETDTSTVSAAITQTRYAWNEYQQGLILGGFFWLHWISQIPGGVLAQRYGTKKVYGLSNVAMCVVGFLIPPLAAYDYRLVVFIRLLQGFIGGLVWPAMHNIIARWIPPNERSTFVTAYTGGSIGVAFTFSVGGLIIDWLGWEAIFHITGVLGVLWYIAWYCLVYDTPDQHPRISEEERTYIANSLGQSVSKRKPRTPWRQIMTSAVLWITILVHWSSNLGIFTLMTQSPTYFKYIHGWNIKMTGVLSGLPHIFRSIFGYLFSVLGDYLIRNLIMSRTGVRKLATAVCCILMGLFTLGSAFSGCNYLSAIICLTAATTVSGAISTGPLASFVDLSPNFAGILMGISCTLSFTAAFISPLIVSILTFQNQTTGQWLLVYLITSALLIIPGLLYICFATSELQPWNSPDGIPRELQTLDSGKAIEEKQDQEMKPLQEDKDNDTKLNQC
ncbi:sialin isoform X2 [Anabrus simplex]|uniref:sialin isoform X2 n=1 Tax=Anabrus simplex TaxID=316456 RepID=UPI0034DCC657